MLLPARFHRIRLATLALAFLTVHTAAPPPASALPPPVVIFGQTITHASDPVFVTTDNDFLQYLSLTRLTTLWTQSASSTSMQEIETALFSATSGPVPPGTPVFIGIYTTHRSLAATATIDSTQAFSIALVNLGQTVHRYYQREGTTFREQSALATTLTGTMTFDAARAFHFAAFDQASLPAYSKLFVFRASSGTGPVLNVAVPDRNFAQGFFNSPRSVAGLSTLGLHGDSLYLSSFIAPGIDECGNVSGCEPGNVECTVNGECAGDDPNDNCASSACVNEAAARGVALGVHVDFPLMRTFRDNWMRLYYEGRQYIAMYYSFSTYAKMDTTSLHQYGAFFAPAFSAIGALMSPSGDPVVVTSLLRTRAQAIIDNHRDVPDATIQSFLNRVQGDLTLYLNKPRSQVISSLKLMDAAAPNAPGWSPLSSALAGIGLFAAGLYTWRRRTRSHSV